MAANSRVVAMLGAEGMGMGMPAHAVGVGQAAEEGSALGIALGPADKVALVGHPHAGEQPKRTTNERPGLHAAKRFLIGRLFKHGRWAAGRKARG
jgi:hypothetical protein